METQHILLIVFGTIAVIAFIYFVVRRNLKDKNDMERELNQKGVKPDKHKSNKI